jgi:hypothetical protein
VRESLADKEGGGTISQPIGWAPPQRKHGPWGGQDNARTPEELQAIVWSYQSHGWVVVKATPEALTLTRPGERSSTAAIVGHVVLTLLTAGAWLLVWLLLLASKNKRVETTIRLVPGNEGRSGQ